MLACEQEKQLICALLEQEMGQLADRQKQGLADVVQSARKEALKLRRVQAELVNKVVGRAGDELRARVKGAKNEKT